MYITDKTAKMVITLISMLIGVLLGTTARSVVAFEAYIFTSIVIILTSVLYGIIQYQFLWGKRKESKSLKVYGECAYCEVYDLERKTLSIYGDHKYIPIYKKSVMYSIDKRFMYKGVNCADCRIIEWKNKTFLADNRKGVYVRILLKDIVFQIIFNVLFSSLACVLLLYTAATCGELGCFLIVLILTVCLIPYEVVNKWRFGMYE